MSEPVVSRETISHLAQVAAVTFVGTGVKPPNPYPPGSDAAAAFKASFERWLLLHTAPESDGSA